MQYEWVTGVFEGQQAKSVMEHVNSGIGYFVRKQSGAGRNVEVEAAFRRPIDGPRPEHLVPATPYQVESLEKLFEQRHGLHEANSV